MHTHADTYPFRGVFFSGSSVVLTTSNINASGIMHVSLSVVVMLLRFAMLSPVHETFTNLAHAECGWCVGHGVEQMWTR